MQAATFHAAGVLPLLPPPPRMTAMALKDEMLQELRGVLSALQAGREFLDVGNARKKVVEQACALGWTDGTCPYLLNLLCPHRTVDDVVWLEGARFNVNLVWNSDRFTVDSICMHGMLALYARSPLGTKTRAIGVGDHAVLDMPVKAASFKWALDTQLGGDHRVRASAIAAFVAFHELFRIPMVL